MANKKYKLKTHKGLKKRVKVTASGKVVAHHAGGSHLQSSKSAKRRRRLRRGMTLNAVLTKKVIKSRPE